MTILTCDCGYEIYIMDETEATAWQCDRCGQWYDFFGADEPDGFYEKETKTRFLTLPGGFSLPLGIAITRICEYDTREEALRAQDAEGRLLELVQADAMRDMIAGSIRSSSVRTEQSGGCIRLYASLRCEEMIARMRPASLKEAIE